MTEKQKPGRAQRLADLIQDAVDKGATTVEEVHKSIADLPLKMLEEIQFLKKPVKEVRRVQDRSIGAVYNLIRRINDQVGTLAADVLTRSPAAKKRPAPARRKAPSAPSATP
jgi:hypothetical protein